MHVPVRIMFKANISYMLHVNYMYMYRYVHKLLHYLVELTGGLQTQVSHDMQVPLISPPHSSPPDLKKNKSVRLDSEFRGPNW